jgi:hypothetical protein
MVSATGIANVSPSPLPSQAVPQSQPTYSQMAPMSSPLLATDTAVPLASTRISAIISMTETTPSSFRVLSSTILPSTLTALTLTPSATTTSLSSSATSILLAPVSASSSTVTVSPTAVDSSSATPTPSSTASKHNPPFYVGIVLGIIVIIAIVAALVAWYLRLHAHARRRQEFVSQYVPWAIKRNNDGSGLEETGNITNSAMLSAPASIRSFMRGDDGIAADVWEPRGDRDVGEPRRTESYEQSMSSSTRRATAAENPFSDAYYSQGNGPRAFLADSAAYPLPLTNNPYRTTRPLTSRLASSEPSVQDHHSASTLGPLQVANMMPGDVFSCDGSSRPGTAMGFPGPTMISEFGTPREPVAGSKPRFWGLDGNGLIVPWNSRQRVPEDFERRAAGGVGKWDHLPPLPMPGENQNLTPQQEMEGWTSSLRSNIVSAFNAVAGNLAASGHDMHDDRLTPAPVRANERYSRDGRLRPMTRESTVLTTASSAWTLEETQDGAGVVHIRGSGLEAYRGGDHAWSPHPSRSIVHINNDSAATFRTYGSQAPLMAAKRPSAARIRPLRRISEAFGLAKATPTRSSSLYSTASAASYSFGYGGGRDNTPQQPRLANIPTYSGNLTMRTRGLRMDDVSSIGSSSTRSTVKGSRIPRRPDVVTRISSSGCSTLSFESDLSGGTQRTQRIRQGN